jgi:hypothetical protein
MGVSKKNLGSIAGDPNKTPKTVGTLTNPSTGPKRSGEELPILLAAGGIDLASIHRDVEQTGEPTASLIFPQSTDPILEESRETLDEVIDGLDDAFDRACSPFPETGSNEGALLSDDDASVQELFCQIAVTYSVPLKNLIFALQSRTAAKKTIEFCRPILHSLRNAAETINLNEAVQRMEQFDAALAEGQFGADLFLKDEVRKKILDAYDALAEAMPETFQFGEESQKRDDIITQSLLAQIPGVGRSTFEKLSRSGLGSLDMLLSANPVDLAAATGIKRKLCVKVCNKVQQYSEEAKERASQSSQSGYHSRLIELSKRLRKLSQREKVGVVSCSTPFSSHRGRSRRQARNQILLEVNVILAELGELELIFQLQKASPKKQVQILSQFLPG